MAAVDFNDGLAQMLELIPDEKTELPVKKVFDTLMRHSIEDYFDHHEVVTDLDAMWKSVGVDSTDAWVGKVESLVANGFCDMMEDMDKPRDYRYQVHYKDGVLTIPFLDMEPRASDGFRLIGKIRTGCLFDATRRHLKFDKHVDESGALDIANDMFVHTIKTYMMGFPTPTESPLENYYEKHQLVEIAYSINDDSAEEYENDSVEDLIAFVFSDYLEEIDYVMTTLYTTLEINSSSVVEIYRKGGLIYVYKHLETIEEIVFKQIYDVGNCTIKEGTIDDPKWLCQCYV